MYATTFANKCCNHFVAFSACHSTTKPRLGHDSAATGTQPGHNQATTECHNKATTLCTLGLSSFHNGQCIGAIPRRGRPVRRQPAWPTRRLFRCLRPCSGWGTTEFRSRSLAPCGGVRRYVSLPRLWRIAVLGQGRPRSSSIWPPERP